MRERGAYLVGPIFVDAIGIEIGNNHTMKLSRVVKESIAFDVECRARAGALGGGG